MSIIDTSGLEDWPDPASLFSAASSLMEHGASFAEHVEGAHSTWKGLGACYETPHQDLLYRRWTRPCSPASTPRTGASASKRP